MTLLTPLVALALAAPPGGEPVATFLDTHCVSCHQGDKPAAGFRLTDLPPTNVAAWANALERVERGEMPPAKRPQPTAAERLAFTQPLAAALLASEVPRQKREGRGLARRLTRVEYERSVQHLFGIVADLKDGLPEDPTADGFDTVAAGQSMSAVLLERYLEAADKAIDALLAPDALPPSKTVTVPQEPEKLKQPKETDYRLRVGVRELPDRTYVLFNSRYQPLWFDRFRAPAAGQYRVRIPAYAYQSQTPLTMGVFAGTFKSDGAGATLVDYFQVPPTPASPRVVEVVVRLPLKGSVKVESYGLGGRDLAFNAPYPGPGLAVMPITVEGPLPEPPPSGRVGMFGALDLNCGTAADAERAFRWLLPRLFRRPDADAGPYLALVKRQLAAGLPFPQAMRAGLKAALVAPDFLFLAAKGPTLDDHELAARLAYFLWASPPDDALRAAAAAGLRGPALAAAVERMLADPKARGFTDHFAGQWLGLRQIDATAPDPKMYPEYEGLLRLSMLRETTAFFDDVLSRDLPVRTFIDSDFAMLNERLAKHYALGGVTGLEIRRVPLAPGTHRGGILTQAAILKVTANGTHSSPVVRGVWVLRNLLGRPPAPPPADVPAIEPDVRGATTIRALVAKHRESVACARCHTHIDPLGLALESYDPIGGYRRAYRVIGGGAFDDTILDGRKVSYRRGPAVDPSGVLLTGEPFADLAALKRCLLADDAAVARCVAGKLLTYGTGTAPTFADRPTLDAVLAAAKPTGYGLKSLVHAVVQSEAFAAR